MAWRNVLAAAYPAREFRGARSSARTSRASGSTRSSRCARATRCAIVLAHRAIPESTYTTVVSSTLVLSIFDIVAASTLLAWAVLTQDELPGLGRAARPPELRLRLAPREPARRPAHPRGDPHRASSSSGSGSTATSLNFWGRVRQAFAVLRTRPATSRSVALWQAGDWTFRLVAIWFLLDAFDIPQSIENVLLVQVSASVATLLPLTPGRHRHRAGVPALRLPRHGAELAAPRVQRRGAAHDRRRRTSSPGSRRSP